MIHEPTEEKRTIVARASGLGLPLKQICVLVDIAENDVDTLKRYYKKEILTGKAYANLRVAGSLFERTKKDTTAAIWWTKSQMGWRETAPIEDQKSMKGLKVNVIEKATDDYDKP